MKADLIELSGARTTLILERAAEGAPLWRWWGPKLGEGAATLFPLACARPLPSFSPDKDQPLTLVPTFGHGWFGQSALLAHRDGRAFEQRFDRCELTWLAPGRAVRFDLHDAMARLRLGVTLAIDPETDAVSVRSEVENLGDDLLDLQWLAAAVLPLPGRAAAVRNYTGRHMDEFRLQSDPLSRSGWRRENRRGLTSHDDVPGAVVVLPGATADAGLAYGACLAWSGNHVQSIDWVDDGRFQWQLGEWLAPGEARLPPGGVHRSPEVVAVCSDRGLNGLAQGFHAALRRRLDWPGGRMRPRPVSLNTWEGFYFRHDLAELKQLADAAAELGVERFVLDDGWFHRRDGDRRGLGDWWPDEAKYPEGLDPLIAHVTGLGLEFGLWVEPEMVNPDSELFRAHPDWALEIAGRPRLTARNQLVLDLARPEAAEHVFGRLDALLTGRPIRYLKWDHNRDLATAGGPDGRARYRAQVEAAYALLARLRREHPEVEIESCAGGGGRIDFGVLRFAHRVWTSDNIDARSRAAIQRGFLQFFPPEIMGAHVGAAPAHTTGRRQSVAFRAGVALPGHFGLELDLRKLDQRDRTALARWIDLYKRLRDLLHGGPVWLGEAEDGLLWQAHGAPDGRTLALFVLRLDPAAQRHPPAVRLPMLDRHALYQVTRLDPAASEEEPVSACWAEPLAGGALAELGLPTPPLKAERCAIFHLRLLDGADA